MERRTQEELCGEIQPSRRPPESITVDQRCLADHHSGCPALCRWGVLVRSKPAVLALQFRCGKRSADTSPRYRSIRIPLMFPSNRRHQHSGQYRMPCAIIRPIFNFDFLIDYKIKTYDTFITLGANDWRNVLESRPVCPAHRYRYDNG